MISTFFAVLGSLGLFLFGMKVLSEGLQKVSGEGLRRLIRNMTRNPLTGITTGMLVTTLVQSSTATTVMLVSFVNARLLQLRQAISLIFGANLGTTTTFWLIALVGFKFSLNHIALPCVGIGVVMIFFKYPKVRDMGQALIGFGILFLGLGLLRDAVPDVQSDPETLAFLSQYADQGFASVLIFFVVGVLLTCVVQSSSVAGAITVTLAAKGWIDYSSAAAIILGENVGTTITANIAALAANTEAKRAARAHFLFNMIGVVWMLIFFFPFIAMVDAIIPGQPDSSADIALHLALFHTLFNFTNICLLVWFIPQIAWISEKMVREKSSRFAFGDHRRFMGSNLPQTGEINLAEADLEVKRMAELTKAMFKGFNEVYENPDIDMGARVKELKAMEEQGDRMAFELSQYLILCASSQISDERITDVTILLRVVAELEGICDCCYDLVRLAERKYRKNRVLPGETQEQIRHFSGQVEQFMDFYINSLRQKVTSADIEIANQLENMIDASRKRLRKEAMRRMNDPANVKSELIYIDILNSIEQIGNHALNILQDLRQRY